MSISESAVKKLAIVFGVIIVVLLGVLIFGKSAKGPTITQPQGATSSDGHLEVSLPTAIATVVSPMAVQGNVTGGGWFFEGSFPIKVLDGDGRILGTAVAQALSDWMTTGTVPFSASVLFSQPHFATGTLVLHNDNPSGLAENDRSLAIPVSFK